MADDALHELTAGYALDALDPAEERAYEQHLAHCERCQAELAELSTGAAALAFGAEAAEPPAALRDRILAAARAERPNVVSIRRRGETAVRVLAAAACVAAVGLGVWDVALHNRLDRSRQALRALTLTGAQGTVVLGPEGQGTLVLAGVRPPPSGKTYEAWLIRGGKAARAGMFGGGQTVVVRLRGRLAHGAVVGVTIERAGGATQPSMPPFVTSAQA